MLGRPAVLVTYTDADEVDIVWVDAAGVLVRLQGKDKALLGRFATGLVPVSRSTWLQRVTTAGVVPSLMDDTSPTLVAPPSSMAVPGVGFDCSGLVQWAYKQAGIQLPRTSFEQSHARGVHQAANRRSARPDVVERVGQVRAIGGITAHDHHPVLGAVE